MNIKICGIQTSLAAVAAYEAGATHIGINFIPTSPRFVMPSAVDTIVLAARGKLKIVGVFQDMPLDIVNDICQLYQLDYAQLHGSETPGYCRLVKVPVIKAISVSPQTTLDQIVAYMRTFTCSAFLLDRAMQGQGVHINLTIAQTLCKQFPCFIAGGLSPETIANTLQSIHPFGIDVASGIESNGVADPEKVNKFIKNAKEIHS